MSAADRMAVRTPDGKIHSVARRVGLGMIARNQAKAAPQQSAPRPGALGARPSPHAAPRTVVSVDGPVTVTAEYDGHTVRITDVQHEPEPDASDVTALPIDAPAIERPKGNAGRDVWAQFARVHGFMVTDDMGRNDIRDVVVAKLDSDRMSRPAFEGGRPATPEDEPVTESTVTHANPGTGTA